MMQSADTRLLRAERDLARAEAKLDSINRWLDAGKPGIFGWDQHEIDKARERVFTLRARVSIRRDAKARS